MTDCNPHSIAFLHCKGHLVEASFSGGAVLLRQADRMPGLTDRAARSLTDTRRKASCRHSLLTMVRQRVYALALGYEDPDDHDELRLGGGDGIRHAWAILALLTRRLRRVWPDVKIVFRGDGGFCRPRMLSWCERNRVDHIVGIARNATLAKKAESIMELAAMGHEASGGKVRVFDEFPYAAKSWRRRSRRVIVKAEHAARGANPRYIVTSPDGAPQWLYDRVYCARGDMENRIKEQQLDLFADRASCHAWWPNQYRLPLSTLAYVLLEAIRRVALAGGELANAHVGTIRLKLLKIGAVVLRNTRRIRLLLSSSCPHQELFHTAAARLQPG